MDPIKGQAAKGILIIRIPTQRDSLKPFLITKTLDEKRHVEIVFGYAQRKRDTSQCLSVVDLQRALSSGFHYQGQLSDRLENLEAMVKTLTNHWPSINQQDEISKIVDRRIESALEHEKMSEKRCLVLTAYPERSSDLSTIFSSTEGSIRRQFENPPILRHGGWSLETLDQAKIMRGEMIRVVNGPRKVMDLYRDATLIFGGLADESFLAWAGNGKPRINSLAIVEVVYNFVNFYKIVLTDCREMPEECSIRIDLEICTRMGFVHIFFPTAAKALTKYLGIWKLRGTLRTMNGPES